METRDGQRTNVGLRINSEDARLGFSATKHSVFDFEQRDLSERLQRDFERYRFPYRDWDAESAATLSL